MSKTQTFAQHLINEILPPEYAINQPLTKQRLNAILIKAFKKYPHRYDSIVSRITRLGNKFATLEDKMTIGLAEIDVPNKKERDQILRAGQKALDKAKTTAEKDAITGALQDRMGELDLKGRTDNLTLAIQSGGLGGKAQQAVKLRSTPTVVRSSTGGIVHELFNKSYSQGIDPLHNWLGAAESRINLVHGQKAVTEPGVFGKIYANLLSGSIVSKNDCNTSRGILLNADDPEILDRYLATTIGRYKKDTLITPQVQQAIMRTKRAKILVRSPQTCQAHEDTVCAMCMGLSNSTGQRWRVGDNTGMIAAGSLAEPAVQLALSAKHSTAKAKVDEGLTDIKGLAQLTEMPKIYPGRMVMAEMYGKIIRIYPAPQGGHYILVRATRPPRKKYIVNAEKYGKSHMEFRYYVSPRRKIVKGLKLNSEVYPGFELTDGVKHLKDVARLRNLGVVRSVAAEEMYNVYKRSGTSVERRHFELLARVAHNYVRIDKAPITFPYKRGEVISYNQLQASLSKLRSSLRDVDRAENLLLTDAVLDYTVGTEITKQVISRLKRNNIKKIKVTAEIEVSPETTRLSTVVNQGTDWAQNLNHRYLKETIMKGAQRGHKSDIHGYKPMASYSYGAEFGQDALGRY